MVLVVVNARRAEQLAGKQMEFVATVSHELRTPLTVIRSAAQNLSAGVVADVAQTQRYGELIDAEGRRLTDMVEQVSTTPACRQSRVAVDAVGGSRRAGDRRDGRLPAVVDQAAA